MDQSLNLPTSALQLPHNYVRHNRTRFMIINHLIAFIHVAWYKLTENEVGKIKYNSELSTHPNPLFIKYFFNL